MDVERCEYTVLVVKAGRKGTVKCFVKEREGCGVD
jgi:hypothetical protein